jgi:hypothetical protein
MLVHPIIPVMQIVCLVSVAAAFGGLFVERDGIAMLGVLGAMVSIIILCTVEIPIVKDKDKKND